MRKEESPSIGLRRSRQKRTSIEVRDRQFVIALARGLRVLQAFSVGDQCLSNAELARRTDLPRPTISRLTHTLSKLGYLSAHPEGDGYRLEPHILTLGYPVLAGLNERQIIRPMLQAIANDEGITAAIAMRDGVHMIFVERVRPPSVTALHQDIGTRVPIATTAIGRAYLAGLSASSRASLLKEIRVSGLPEWWPQMNTAVEREMTRFNDHGYCVGGEWNPEVNGVAVPVVLQNNVLLAIGCGGARKSLSDERLGAIGERLKSIVQGLQKMPIGGL